MIERWLARRRRAAGVHRALVITAVLAGAMAMVPTTASAQPASGQPAGAYAALGDSYSSGVGTGRYDLDAGCQRSSLAYPYLWQAANRPAGFEFLACGGARITDVRAQASGSTQLPQAELVTLTAGGNDVGFGTVLSVCTDPSKTDDQCYAAVEQGESIATSATFHDGMVSLLSVIGNRAPGAHVEVLGYPTLFEETTECARDRALASPPYPDQRRCRGSPDGDQEGDEGLREDGARPASGGVRRRRSLLREPPHLLAGRVDQRVQPASARGILPPQHGWPRPRLSSRTYHGHRTARPDCRLIGSLLGSTSPRKR